MIALGCDPDTHTAAIAICDGNHLLWHHVTTVARKHVGDDAVSHVAFELLSLKFPDLAVEKIAVEQMVVYPNTDLGKEGIDGLMRVAAVAGAAVAVFRACWPRAQCAMPTPREWKQGKKKAKHHPAILRWLDEESREHIAKIPLVLRGHLLDAVGLAQWAQGAAAKRRDTRKEIMAAARVRARKARPRRR